MYYARSIAKIEAHLVDLGFESKQDPNNLPTGEHLHWMCSQVAQMNDWSLYQSGKAARWIGWMFDALEEGQRTGKFNHPGQIWTNEVSREQARKDVDLGYDRPVWLRWTLLLKRRG